MELVSTIEAGDRWVTHCAWAPWEVSDAEAGVLNIATQMYINVQPSATAVLACGLSNGNVVLIDVTQKFLFAPPGSPSSLKITTAIRDEKVATPDKRIITAMRWVSKQGNIVSGLVLFALILHSS